MTNDKRTGHKIMYLAVNKTLGKPDGDDDENYVGTIDELTLQDILENPRPWKGDIEIVTGQIEQLRKERDELAEGLLLIVKHKNIPVTKYDIGETGLSAIETAKKVSAENGIS